jgi:tetratricopeptide (TPR) repeat protein
MRLFERLLELPRNHKIDHKIVSGALTQPAGAEQTTPQSTPARDAYSLGDYESALKTTLDPGLRAMVLMQLGRLEEAEDILVPAVCMYAKLPAEAGLSHQAVDLNLMLADVLMERERYAEAIECLEQALSLVPGRAAIWRSLAETWLRRGDSTAEALRCARKALEMESQGSAPSGTAGETSLAQAHATLAWAVGVHQHDAVEVVRLAGKVEFPAYAPSTAIAQAHFALAMAWNALNDVTRVRICYEKAARIDPNGIWGRRAAARASADTAPVSVAS